MGADDGTQIDDASAFCAEPFARLLSRENHAENVDVVVEVKALFGNLCQGAEAEHAGVVDQNVQSSKRGIHFFEQPRDICGFGDIGADRYRLTAGISNRLNHSIGPFLVRRVIYGHARALVGKCPCDATAYAFRRARHYGYFARQSAHFYACFDAAAQGTGALVAVNCASPCGIFGFCRVVSERCLASEQLRRGDIRFRETAGHGIMVLRLAVHSQEWLCHR